MRALKIFLIQFEEDTEEKGKENQMIFLTSQTANPISLKFGMLSCVYVEHKIGPIV